VTITLLLPADGGLIGPGTQFEVYNNLIGPIPSDDVVHIFLQHPTTFAIALHTAVVVAGEHHVYGMLGVSVGTPNYPLIEGNSARLAQGDAVLVYVEWYHATGPALFSIYAPGSWAFDAVGGLGNQIAKLHTRGTAGSSTLDDVLAAVRKTFP
jgi:hypothetical protein